jgi:2-hydroxychromene-2-carboxylate isomerase
MVRDIERIAEARGLMFRLPEPFPQNSLLAARLALVGLEEGWGPAFIRAIFSLEFAKQQNVADRSTLVTALAAAGARESEAFHRSQSPEIKSKLRENTDEAQAQGIFGAPSFTTESGELFWGDDRLEDALLWSRRVN